MKIKNSIRQLIFYGIIGGLSAGIDFAIFNVLIVCAGLYHITANSLSVLVGIMVSFCLNRTFNFKVTDKVAVRFSLFFSCGMLGLLLSNCLMWLGVDKFHFSETSTKVFTIFAVAFIQFTYNKFITFKAN